MGGWISILGTISDFDYRLSRFKKIFSVENVPNLRVEVHDGVEGIKTIGWAWNHFNIPDFYVTGMNNNHILVLCGVITDLGIHGPVLPDQDQTAAKILDLWLEYGEKIVHQLNGSFSCLLYDKRENKISLFTDRFASRSVWMTEEDGTWIVGNFPSAIAVIKKRTPRVDPVGLWSLIHAGRHLGYHGLYSNIRALLAGQKAILSPGSNAMVSHWWERKYEPENNLSAKEWGYRLAEGLKNSANRYRKVSRNPYLFLSGGLDSRIVASAFEKPLKTLTLCTEPNAESRIASMSAKAIGLEHRTIIRSPYWYLNTMNASALISSGNHLDHHTHFIVPVRDISSDNSASEFLLGDLLENFNKHYFSKPSGQELVYRPDMVKDFLFANVPYTVRDPSRLGIHFRNGLRGTLGQRYGEALKEYATFVKRVSRDPADCYDTFLRWADVSVTPTYNMITCIWPIAKEINLCLDNDLNNLSLKIPSSIRSEGILHKWTLYHISKKLLLIPDANNFLPPIVPNELKQIIKKIRPLIGGWRRTIFGGKGKPVLKTSGSWLLLHEMYRKDKSYRERIEKLLNDKELFTHDIFDLNQVKNTWREYLNGNISLHIEIEALLSYSSLRKLVLCDGFD